MIDHRILIDTLELIKLYNTNSKFKAGFDQAVKIKGALFKRRPIKVYLFAIKAILPQYTKYYSQENNPDRLNELFSRLWVQDRTGFSRLEELSENPQPNLFSPAEAKELEEAEALSKNEGTQLAAVKKYEEALKQSGQPAQATQTLPPKRPAPSPLPPPQAQAPAPNPPEVPGPRRQMPFSNRARLFFHQLKSAVPYPAKNLTVNAASAIVRNIRALTLRNPLAATSILTGIAGGVAGFSTGSPLAIIGGAVIGALTPRALQNIVEPSTAPAYRLSIPGPALRLPQGVTLAGRTATVTARSLFFNPWVLGAMAILGIIFLFVFTKLNENNALLGLPGDSSQPAASSFLSCDITGFNIFDVNAVTDIHLEKFVDLALSSGLVKKGTEQETLFIKRAMYIRDQAKAAGLNLAIFLGYWKSETGFSDYTYPGVRPGADLGCDPLNPALKSFEDSVLCAVGKSSISNSRTSQCAVSRDIDSPSCRAIAFQQQQGVTLPIATLKDFFNSYGSKIADPNNIHSDNTVKKLIAELGLSRCSVTGPSSCPLGGSAKTTTGTRAYPEASGGHCGQNYPANTSWCSQDSLNRTITSKATFAIDVAAGGKTDVPVMLPTIGGENLKWSLVTALPVANLGGGLDFEGIGPTGQKYFLHLYHLAGQGTDITGFDKTKTEFNSGDIVATRLYPLAPSDGGPHLHFTIAAMDPAAKTWTMIEPNYTLHMCDGQGGTP